MAIYFNILQFLIVLSAIGISLGQICLGAYAMFKQDGYDVSSYGWIPLSCFSFVIFIASIGVLTLPFLVIAELIPEKVQLCTFENDQKKC